MNRLREVRIEKKMTQKDLATKVHISIPYVSDIEKGNRSGSYKTQLKIAKALGVKRREIFKDDDEEEDEDGIKQVG